MFVTVRIDVNDSTRSALNPVGLRPLYLAVKFKQWYEFKKINIAQKIFCVLFYLIFRVCVISILFLGMLSRRF